MGNDHDHHDHEHSHDGSEAKEGVTFNHDGTNYTVSLEAATNSGLEGNRDRIQLPGGQLILLHPHAHEDNANSPEAIKENGGQIWQAEVPQD